MRANSIQWTLVLALVVPMTAGSLASAGEKGGRSGSSSFRSFSGSGGSGGAPKSLNFNQGSMTKKLSSGNSLPKISQPTQNFQPRGTIKTPSVSGQVMQKNNGIVNKIGGTQGNSQQGVAKLPINKLPIIKTPNLGGIGGIVNKPIDSGIGNGQSGGKQIDPKFNQGGKGIGIGIGGSTGNSNKGINLGIGIGVGGGNHDHNHHHHHGQHKVFPWWYKGHGYCGGYHNCSPCYIGTKVVYVPVGSAAPVVPVIDHGLAQVPVGAQLNMQSIAIGPEVGTVLVQVGTMLFPAQVNDWQVGTVTFTLPQMMLIGPTKADLIAVDPQGNILAAQPVELIAAEQTADATAMQQLLAE